MPEQAGEAKRIIEKVFDDAAESYDRAGPNIFAQFGERLIEHIPLSPGARVLDIATGKGAALLPAARRVGPKGRAVGIDLSGALLKEAESAAHAEGLSNVELRKMDAEHLEFPDQSFDAVTCAFAIFFFPNIDAALREMYRVCKPDGFIGIANFNKTPPPFTPGFPILFQQIMAHQIKVDTTQQFAYTPQEAEALLNRFGFSSIKTHKEVKDIIYKNLEDWWAFLLTVASRATIMSMDENTRARFKDEYFSKLRPLLRQDGLHLSLGVIYTIAKR